MAARRRRGEDGISFEHRGPCRDTERHRHCPGLWRGEITLEYTSDGKRARRRVSGKTRAAVVDKLRELHTDLRLGIVPKTGHANYTVRQAADDWLANGLAGRSPKTVKKNQNMIEPILKVIGARKLRELSAANVRRALSWQHVNWTATRKPILPSRPMWPCGDRCDCTAKLRLSGHAARSLFPRWRQQRSGRCRKPEGRTAPGR